MIKVSLERGTAETFDSKDARSVYLTVQVGRSLLMFVVGRS